jgi:type IV fimbrial biogenesis protein FimT
MNKQNGFSLIELMVTLAVASIVLSIAIPSYQTAVQNNRRTTAVSELATALQLARSTAISQRVFTVVCKSPDGATCPTGAGSGDWTQGWMIFTDADNNGSLDAGGTDTLIRVHDALTGNATFIGNNNVINQVSFSPQGLTRNNGTITHCDARGATDASALIISVGGQVRHARDTNDDGIVDTGTAGTVGVNVTCP